VNPLATTWTVCRSVRPVLGVTVTVCAPLGDAPVVVDDGGGVVVVAAAAVGGAVVVAVLLVDRPLLHAASATDTSTRALAHPSIVFSALMGRELLLVGSQRSGGNDASAGGTACRAVAPSLCAAPGQLRAAVAQILVAWVGAAAAQLMSAPV
jgi:hypothetical protein